MLYSLLLHPLLIPSPPWHMPWLCCKKNWPELTPCEHQSLHDGVMYTYKRISGDRVSWFQTPQTWHGGHPHFLRWCYIVCVGAGHQMSCLMPVFRRWAGEWRIWLGRTNPNSPPPHRNPSSRKRRMTRLRNSSHQHPPHSLKTLLSRKLRLNPALLRWIHPPPILHLSPPPHHLPRHSRPHPHHTHQYSTPWLHLPQKG